MRVAAVLSVDRHAVGSMEKESGRKRYVRGGASVGFAGCVVNQVGSELRGIEEGAEMRWWWARRSSHMILVVMGGSFYTAQQYS